MVTRRGSGSGGCLLSIVVLAVVFFVGWPAVQVYVRAYEYEDALRQTLLYSNGQPDANLRERMRAAADSIGGLPDEAYDITVERQTDFVRLSAQYTDTIRFPMRPREVTHSFSVERKE